MNYILKNENALFFECGYSSDNAIFLNLESDLFFITDGRYSLEAKENIKNAQIIQTKDLIKSARELIRKSKIKKLYFDPKEWNYFEFNLLKDKLKNINFSAKKDFSMLKRAVKTEDELKLIKEAVRLGRHSFMLFAVFLMKYGNDRSEKLLQYKFKEFLSDFGESELSFEPIVAINENAAKPHSIASEKVLRDGDLILVDAGVKYKRYCSDRTRTAFFNRETQFSTEQNFKDKKVQKVYDLVLKAHDLAIQKARVGMRASKIDKIARDVISDGGFGEFFVHSTGHGVGLDIHEFPIISSKSEMIIEENMVFTIEPGIYIPNEFGVRIEDMVTMKNGVATIL